MPSSLPSSRPTCQGPQVWSTGPIPGDFSQLGATRASGTEASARSGRVPGGPGVPDTPSQVLGMGQPSLPGAFGAGVLSALWSRCPYWQSTEKTLDLASKVHSPVQKSHSILSPFPPGWGGEGTKASLLLGFRESQIQFQVCQGNLQGLGFSASTKRIQLISFYKQWDAHVPLEARARAPSEASTLYNLDAGPDRS